jgi:hypothetical protein
MRILYILMLLTVPVIAEQDLSYVDSENPGDAPCGIAVARTQADPFLLVGSHLEDKVTSYRLDRNNGAMTPAGVAEIAPGSRPAAIDFAYGRYAVVANQASSDLYVFSMDNSGQMTQVGQPEPTRGLNPVDMVVAPTGLVAVTNNQSNELSAFWLDLRGRLSFLDKIETGAQPAGVAIHGNRIAVANSGSADVSVFHLEDLRELQHDNTTAVNGGAPLDVVFDRHGLNLYVAIAALAEGQPAQLQQFSLNLIGLLTQTRSVDAGRFLSGLTRDGSHFYGALLNAADENELRVYDPDLNQIAVTVLTSPPASMTLAATRVRTGRYLFVNDFGISTTTSFQLQEGLD